MVKIFTTEAAPDYSNPWALESPSSKSGSGCIIENQLILTNAHVVSDQKFILVRLFGQAQKYKADIVAVSKETDLALLSVDNPSFYKNIIPLSLGVLPELQNDVYVFGFPKGGDTLSITKGVVSRIEHIYYANSFLKFLAVQFDASINSGNSGGPVIADGEIIGLATQSMLDAENANYAVPVTMIHQFLDDFKDGQIDGIPTLAIRIQKMENSALRKKYGMKSDQTGILVKNIASGSENKNAIKEQDILLEINGHPIANDGTVEFRPNERTSFKYVIDHQQVGNSINLELLRNGQKKQVSIKLKDIKYHQIARVADSATPSYFIFGGFVFSPLTLKYLQEWGDEWYADAPTEFLYLSMDRKLKRNKEDVIIIIKVLPHTINAGYHDISDEVVDKVNGITPKNFCHFVTIIKNAQGEYVEFKLANDDQIVMNRQKAIESNIEILNKYNIRKDLQ